MKLSVIIVNYNVQYFLENCLRTVQIAANKLGECEVFVVDNNSVDGSMKMVKDKYPDVIRIENKVNVGFSKANNQAILLSKGEFVLLLNPDTVVEEDTFLDCYNFMKATPDAGGLGISMIDGKGIFLPESKRGLPTPSVAFYKIFGLSSLFPKSKRFGKYHLGYLDNNETNEVDVLSGAYMWLRKETLDKVGLLDESFFMYGEDIDLSYRITLGGYKNYYFPKARIIHYKGESTKKSSINYVFVFYKAMVIFAKKHFSQKNAKLFSFFINLAIYLRATIALIMRFVRQIALPILDALILLVGMYFITDYYEENVRFIDGGAYPDELINIGFIVMIAIFIVANIFSSVYSRKHKIANLFKGIFLGGIIILSSYSLLDEEFRFSRAIIVFSILWGLIALPIVRFILHLLGINKLRGKQSKRIAIVGNKREIKRIEQFLKETLVEADFLARINPNKEGNLEADNYYLSRLYQLNDVVEIYKINEVIFCSKDIGANEILSQMSEIKDKSVEFKIAPPESLYIIGSNSIQNSGEFYIMDTNAISKPTNRRKKRALDIGISIMSILISPILLLIVKSKAQFIANIFIILRGQASWVGYHWSDKIGDQLPLHKKGVLAPADNFDRELIDPELINKTNYQYSRNYSTAKDIEIIIKNTVKLGNYPH